MLRSETFSSLQQITDATRPTQEQPITLENMFHFCYMARKTPDTALGTIDGFGAVAATICSYLGVASALCGTKRLSVKASLKKAYLH